MKIQDIKILGGRLELGYVKIAFGKNDK